MSSHDCLVTGTFNLQHGNNLPTVASALSAFLTEARLSFDEQVAAGNIQLDENTLSLHLAFHGFGGSDNAEVQELATSLSAICLDPGWIELMDFDTGDTDIACVPYFIGTDERDRTIASVLYGVEQMREWVEPVLGKAGVSLVDDMILALAAGKPLEQAAPLPPRLRKLLEGLVDVLNGSVIGLIGAHLGQKSMARVSTALTGIKSYLFDRTIEQLEALPDHDQMRQVCVPEVLGEHDDFAQVPEWIWIESVASFVHTEVADRIVHIMHADDDAIPAKLQSVFAAAKADGMQWLLFHFGK